MNELIITILVLNLLIFAVDMNEDWRENRYAKKSVLALLLVMYLFIGFLSPVYRIILYVKENK